MLFQSLVVKFDCLLENVLASAFDPGFPESTQHSCAAWKESNRSENNVIFTSCLQLSAYEHNLEKAVAFACTIISAEVNQFLTTVLLCLIFNVRAADKRPPLTARFPVL